MVYSARYETGSPCSFKEEGGRHYNKLSLPLFIRIHGADTMNKEQILYFKSEKYMYVSYILTYLRFYYNVSKNTSLYLRDVQYPSIKLAYHSHIVGGKSYKLCRTQG